MKVSIYSFSYKATTGIPPSINQPHGGGFVFDCRCLPNPGKQSRYQHLSGLDKEVIQFLDKNPAIERFASSVFAIVTQAVENYLQRDFKHLSVGFGCTGGQHRSVYFAECLSERLRQHFKLEIALEHLQKCHWRQAIYNKDFACKG